jgi:adenylate cyclase
MAHIFQVGIGASQDRLEKLIEARLAPGADKAQIDQRIWDLFGEEWAVMFTDLAGFSRKVVDFGIIHFLQTIHESHRLLVPCIDRFDGILLKTAGDSMLVIFRSVSKALECALEMQATLAPYNAQRIESEQVLLCVGLGHGPMLRIGDQDVFGPEVNAAAKLGEDRARAHEILVTGAVAEQVREAFPYALEAIDSDVPGAATAFRVRYRD